MRRLAWALVALAYFGAVAAADAPSSRAVIDRIELEPSVLTGQRLTVHLSAMSREGAVIELDRSSIKATAGSEIKAPFAVGRYAQTGLDTAIVVVVQSTVDWSEVLPVIADRLDEEVFAKLNDKTQVAIITYGEAVGAGKLTSLKTARAKVKTISSDGTGGDPALLDTLDRALGLFKKIKTTPANRPVRKMILLIGDGRDASGDKPAPKPKTPPKPTAPPPAPTPTPAPANGMGPGPGAGSGSAGSAAAPPAKKPVFQRLEPADRARVIALGDRAAKEGVRIHSFAFSPTNNRYALLALGELSKRSLGTFRWVALAKAESWAPAFKQLADEINNQYVLTYFLGKDDDVAGKKLKITTKIPVETESNELKIPTLGCAGEPCEGYCASDGHCVVPLAAKKKGIFGWLMILVIGAVVVIALLTLIGFIISKIQSTKVALPPGMQMPPGVVKPPGGKQTVNQMQGMQAIQVPQQAPPAAAPTSGPRLMILTGPRSGEVIAVRHGFTIGKIAGCDLVIDDGYTSSHHAQIHMDQGNNCRLYDLSSTNGTFVNGVRVTEYHLDHGASVRVGSTELRFLSQ